MVSRPLVLRVTCAALSSLAALGQVAAPASEMDLPAVQFQDLQRGSKYALQTTQHALQELGVLLVTGVPGFAAARREALRGAASCLGGYTLGGQASRVLRGVSATLRDGSSRRSLAAWTSPEGVLGPLRMGDELLDPASSCGGAWRVAAEQLRLGVRAAALQVAAAAFPSRAGAHAAASRSPRSSLGDAIHGAQTLEHFHLYEPAPQARQASDALSARSVSESSPPNMTQSLPMHVDAGFLIAATMGFDVLRGDSEESLLEAGPLVLQLPGGDGVVRPRLRSEAVLIMVGQGLVAVTQDSGLSLRAAPHALTLDDSSPRAWFGAMLLPSGEMQRAEESASLSCHSAPIFREAADLAATCPQGSLYCWMQCMPTPACPVGEAPTCVNAETGAPADVNAMCPTCNLQCSIDDGSGENASIASGSGQTFCNGAKTDMYMDGFKLAGNPADPCLVLLFPSLVLDTKLKFWVAVIFVFVCSLLVPEALRNLKSGVRAYFDSKDRPPPCFVERCCETCSTTFAYAVMLLTMTFSLELFGAVVLGLALGKGFFTGRDRHKGQNGHSEGGTLCCSSFDGATPPEDLGKKARGCDQVVELRVTGMTCSSCAYSVQRGLLSLDGVGKADVVFASNCATVAYDSKLVDPAKLCAAIEDIGYDAELNLPQEMQVVGLRVTGMTCSSCVSTLKRGLLAVEGVGAAEVALASKLASVEYDAKIVDTAKLCSVIEGIGFHARVLNSQRGLQQDALSPARQSSEGLEEPAAHREPLAFLHLHGSVDLVDLADMASVAGEGFVSARRLDASALGDGDGLIQVAYDPRVVGARRLLDRLREGGGKLTVPAGRGLGHRVDSVHQHLHDFLAQVHVPSLFVFAALGTIALVPTLRREALLGQGASLQLLFLALFALLSAWAAFLSRAGRLCMCGARAALRKRTVSMEALVSGAACATALAALALSIYVSARIVAAAFYDARAERDDALTDLADEALHFSALPPVLLLIAMGGKMVESWAAHSTSARLEELVSRQPATASLLVMNSQGRPWLLDSHPVELLELGDVCTVVAGSRFPADGVVVSGSGAADESIITGESALVNKGKGASEESPECRCHGGSLLVQGELDMRVTALGEASSLGRLRSLLEQAQHTKPTLQEAVGRYAARLAYAMLGLAVGTIVCWLSVPLPGAPKDSLLRACFAVRFGLSVALLSCPCALSLAVPTAIREAIVAAGVGSHCLVRDAAVLERAGVCRGQKTHLLLDKACATEGRPCVTAVGVCALPAAGDWLRGLEMGPPSKRDDETPDPNFYARTMAEHVLVMCDSNVELLSRDDSPVRKTGGQPRAGTLLREGLPVFWQLLRAAGASCPAQHMSKAVVDFCAEHVPGSVGGAQVLPADFWQNIPGRGMHAQVSLASQRKVAVSIGNPAMLPELEERYPCCDWPSLRAWAEKLEANEEVTILFAAAGNGEVACGFALRDRVRAGTAEAVRALRHAYGPDRCEVWVTTADSAATAYAVAATLDVLPRCIRFGQSPSQKRELVQELQADGHEVIMFGHAFSDADALAEADIGVAMGAGANFHCEGADVVLCRNALADFLALRALALATRRSIIRSVSAAFGMSILGLPLSCGAAYPWGISLPPLAALAVMAASSVLAVGSSLVLRRLPPAGVPLARGAAHPAGPAALAIVGGTQQSTAAAAASFPDALQQPLL